jgi:hypothetical protein
MSTLPTLSFSGDLLMNNFDCERMENQVQCFILLLILLASICIVIKAVGGGCFSFLPFDFLYMYVRRSEGI